MFDGSDGLDSEVIPDAVCETIESVPTKGCPSLVVT